LLQLSASGQGERHLENLRKNNPALLERLNQVPGFSDLLASIKTGATGSESEVVFQHLRLASWYYSLTPGQQEGLVSPENIFTRPG